MLFLFENNKIVCNVCNKLIYKDHTRLHQLMHDLDEERRYIVFPHHTKI